MSKKRSVKPAAEKKTSVKTVPENKNWLVYMILCSDDSLYTGITNDMDRRFSQHKNKQGAKYFYGRKPEKIVFLEKGHNRSTASKREYELKRYSKLKKLAIIDHYQVDI